MRFVACLLALLASCGTPAPSGEDAGAADAGTPASVTVSLGADTKSVDLTLLARTTIGARRVVTLAAIAAAAFPSEAVSGLTAGFKAADGYDPSTKANCAGKVPVDGASLDKGGLDPVTRNLTWDDSLSLPGCLYVDDCAQVLLTRK